MMCNRMHVQTSFIWWGMKEIHMRFYRPFKLSVDELKRIWFNTFAFRPYFAVMLKKGTIVMVKAVPHRIPPIMPTKCCCHGSVPIANINTIRSNNFISAMCGRLSCLQWIITSKTVIDDATPANAAKGPT